MNDDNNQFSLMRGALKSKFLSVGIYVDIGRLAKDESNYARSERKFEHAGVAAHPGDKGMAAIAEAILDAINKHQGKKIK